MKPGSKSSIRLSLSGRPSRPTTDLVRSRVAGVFAAGKPVHSNLIKGSATKKYVVSVEYPVVVADGRKFLISQWIYSSRLNELLPSKDVPKSWLITVFDRQAITIARNRNTDQYVGEPPKPKLRQAILNRHEGISRSFVREGIEMYGAWAISRTTGWSVGIGVPVEELEHAAVRSVGLTATGFVLALTFAMLGAVLFSRRLLGAIDKVSHAAGLLGKRELPHFEPLPVDEMNQLQLAIHRAGHLLLASEQERSEHLQNAENARAAAERAQTIAEAQNSAKDEFLAMLGHELRNPLAAITSGVALLSLPGIDATRARNATAIIERQSRQLSHLVDELLDAHRILTGKISISTTGVDLAAAVASCLTSFEARGAMRTHRITSSLTPVWIEADPTRLEQMTSNLLENALKYTHEGGSIHVDVRQDDQSALLSISDTGIGIAAELIPTMFDVFVQGKVVNRSKGGLGIGLAVVDSLAKQHGATLTAASAGPNQGSTFSIRFPARAMPRSATSVESDTGTDPHGQVLVIEDNDDVREVICSLLREAGFDVVAADCGQRGIDIATASLPETALIDIDLPDMSGYEVARQLRALDATAGMKLIAVTGYGQESDRQKALASGFDVHLRKPVDIGDVIAAIRAISRPALSP